MDIQYRFRPSGMSSDWTDWKEWPPNINGSGERFCPLGFSDGVVQVREKPKFQPGYYEAVGATHDVQWFDRPPNDPIWHRVKVTRDGD